jgi:hypothetical protein
LDSQVEEQKILRQYLLGDLPSESQKSLEERLLTDDEFYEELLMAEDDLVDQYLAGSLSGRQRDSFENRFLITPERWRKLNFASALRKHVARANEQPGAESADSARVPQRRLFPWVFHAPYPAVNRVLAVTFLLLVAVMAWVAVKTWRAHDVAETEVATHVFNVELTPGAVREGGRMKRITPPADGAVIRLGLDLPADDYPRYSGALQADDGRVLLSRDNLQARETGGAHSVSLDVPVEVLPPGDYRVKLSGVTAAGAPEDIASYSFRVVR